MEKIGKYRNIIILHILGAILINTIIMLYVVGETLSVSALGAVNALFLMSFPLSAFLSNRYYPKLLKVKNIIKFLYKELWKGKYIYLLIVIFGFFKMGDNITFKGVAENLLIPFLYINLWCVLIFLYGFKINFNKE